MMLLRWVQSLKSRLIYSTREADISIMVTMRQDI